MCRPKKSVISHQFSTNGFNEGGVTTIPVAPGIAAHLIAINNMRNLDVPQNVTEDFYDALGVWRGEIRLSIGRLINETRILCVWLYEPNINRWSFDTTEEKQRKFECFYFNFDCFLRTEEERSFVYVLFFRLDPCWIRLPSNFHGPCRHISDLYI